MCDKRLVNLFNVSFAIRHVLIINVFNVLFAIRHVPIATIAEVQIPKQL